MSRKKIVAGNWKMNIKPSETKGIIDGLKDNIKDSNVDVVFCVPFGNLHAALEAVQGTNIAIGAQNMHCQDSGAFTGEISADMLADMGVKYVILGHSERRSLFGETDVIVNKKTLKALEKNLVPIVCVGETLEEREQGITVDLVRLQTKVALTNVTKEQAKGIVLAYEPVWAIGTGKTATSAQAEEVCKALREVLAEIYDEATASEIRIQYGGSVNGANATEIFSMENIDGGLVGGASLKPEFEKIINH